jgi:hypothetical protein
MAETAFTCAHRFHARYVLKKAALELCLVQILGGNRQAISHIVLRKNIMLL